MYIAEEKRKNNIAEYLIYMFQVEDSIRSMNFDIEKIETHIIVKYNLSYSDKRDIREWYLSLIGILRENNLLKSGHNPLLRNIMSELNDLHIRLISNPDEGLYQQVYQEAKPVIRELTRRSGNPEKHEIEICLDGLYGLFLLRLAGKPINPETEKAFGLISKLLSLLSARYKLVEEGKAEI